MSSIDNTIGLSSVNIELMDTDRESVVTNNLNSCFVDISPPLANDVVSYIDGINGANLGNILIKHNDKWRGSYYLKDNLTFTVDRSLAARFYILKSGDTTILNGDRITLNSGNRSISVAGIDTIRLLDRALADQRTRESNSFIVTNGTDNTDPITYETSIYFISNKDQRTALKYEWGMDLITPSDSSSVASNYKPRHHPNLINGFYGGDISSIHPFEFILEKADGPITNLDSSRNLITMQSKLSKNSPHSSEFFEGYKGAIMIMLLMIILVLCVLLSR